MAALGETVVRRIRSVFVKDDSRSAAAGRHPFTAAECSNLTTPQALCLLAREGGLRALKIWACKLFSNRGGFRPLQSLLALKAEILWSRGDHAGVRRIADRLVVEHQSTLGLFYLAQLSFVRGGFEVATEYLRELLSRNPDHGDAVYLLASCLRETGGTADAWSLLEDLAQRSPRPKTWQQLANLVDNAADLQRILACHAKARENNVVPAYSREISNHLSLAAMRADDYGMAKAIWRKIIEDALASPSRFKNRRPRVDIYSRGRAETALLDLKKTLDQAGIEMFLVSGTLLGCVREGRLLDHDKDIDVGIWEDVPTGTLTAAIHNSGLFVYIPSQSPWIVRIRHLNGIPLDLFYHYRGSDSFWHGGTKIKWHNSPFSLKPTPFLNETFLIPADYDTYLKENYGDWVTPKTDFDSMFDTPNGEVIQQDDLIVHCLRKLFESVSKGSPRKIEYYLGKLDVLGERDFAARFREKHLDRPMSG
jgi:tetratricopeptide (TPR) repeat protein